jgi:hypothetical protein
MKFDINQQVSLAVAVLAFGYFLAHTIQKRGPVIAPPPSVLPEPAHGPAVTPSKSKSTDPRAALRQQALTLAAEGASFLMERGNREPPGDHEAYERETAGQFVNRFGTRLVLLQSRLKTSGVKDKNLDQAFGGLGGQSPAFLWPILSQLKELGESTGDWPH